MSRSSTAPLRLKPWGWGKMVGLCYVWRRGTSDSFQFWVSRVEERLWAPWVSETCPISGEKPKSGVFRSMTGPMAPDILHRELRLRSPVAPPGILPTWGCPLLIPQGTSARSQDLVQGPGAARPSSAVSPGSGRIAGRTTLGGRSEVEGKEGVKFFSTGFSPPTKRHLGPARAL